MFRNVLKGFCGVAPDPPYRLVILPGRAGHRGGKSLWPQVYPRRGEHVYSTRLSFSPAPFGGAE